jgi:hypothetical protein
MISCLNNPNAPEVDRKYAKVGMEQLGNRKDATDAKRLEVSVGIRSHAGGHSPPL